MIPEVTRWLADFEKAQCRIYSKYLALQIKAAEEGLIQPGTAHEHREAVAQ